MSDRKEPQPKKKHPLASALVDIVDIAVTGDYSSDDSPDVKASPQTVAGIRIKEWGKFARKQARPYRETLPIAEILADPRLSAFFEEMRQLHVPVHGAAGLLEAEWQGVPFISFAAYSVDETETVRPFRLVCAALSRDYPDLVHDRRLDYAPQERRHWYPGHESYERVEGPKPPPNQPGREPGLLGRTKVGREFRRAVEAFTNPVPRLHAASKDYASQVSSRPYEPAAFERDWLVRGRWLVLFEEEHIRGYGARDKTGEFLDTLPAIKRLVDPSEIPEREEA
ncbi:hypothetical protein O1R50_25685 [Glycomyces luteolus]|uniref:Uncharacterized protein n=1 Tax=Glycomyces luteolus TaxID=2670330 RepID=A0A9X3PFC7_9ACTN|nr:hypothetical protein [Glycomyces luteolus]MDA1363031.1 hypothetical protein [Glycomyces luteolus]